MSLPYFPMYPTDFEAKTSHLTLIEDGAYNRLLRLCWMTPGCSLPDDEAWIMRRVRARTDDEIAAVRIVLAEFFQLENGRLHQAKLTRIWREAHDAHQRRVNAGSSGGKSKALKIKETMPSNATAKPKQPEPEPDIREDTNVSSWRKSSPLEGFDAFWEIWPSKINKDAARRAWKKMSLESRRLAYRAVRDGWFERWRQGSPDANPIHASSFLNGKRWEDQIQTEKNHGNGNRRTSSRPSPHSTLFAAARSLAGGNDGGSAEPLGEMRDVTPTGETGLADGQGGNASEPFLRIIDGRS